MNEEYDMELPHSEGILSSQLDDDEFFPIASWPGSNTQDQILDNGQVTTGKRNIDELYQDDPPEEKPKQPTTKRKASTTKAKTNRFDTSLSKLTEKFVKLIHQNKKGIVDLNIAAESLGVPKRRIYDITNVLEGIGLIEKKSKSNIQWKGNDIQRQREVDELEQEIKCLRKEETTLDQQIQILEEQSQNWLVENANDSFLTVEDIRGLEGMKNQVLMVFRAPPGTQLGLEQEVVNQEELYRIQMQSPGGAIGVWVINEPQETTPQPAAPVVPQFLANPTDPSDFLAENPAIFDDDFAGISDYYAADDAFLPPSMPTP